MDQGWQVIRIWESDLKSNLDIVLKKIFMAIGNYDKDEI